MAWAGTGVIWRMSGGIMKGMGMSQLLDKNTGGLKTGLVYKIYFLREARLRSE